ncbi:hypothetical protein TNCV_1130821, partial [Trichonephila clavipes]
MIRGPQATGTPTSVTTVPRTWFPYLKKSRFIHWGLGKLDLTRFSGYKFRSSSAKGACRSSALSAR